MTSPLVRRYSLGHGNPYRLTPTQLQALALYASGKSRKEAAAIMGVKTNSFSTYLEYARMKMGCATNAQLMFRLGQEWRA